MKKIVNLFILFVLVFSLSGCLKRDNMEDISIYTTNYPSEYITQRLYGDYSDIKSIYPDGVNIKDYKLTNKQIEDYSKADLFIFNGISDEKDYVEKMRKDNGKFKETVSNGNSKIIVASSNLFKYLEKYGITVYSLDESNTDVNAIYRQVLNLANEGSIKYVFTIANEKSNSTVQKLLDNTDLEDVEWHTLSILTEEERSENEDYFTLMNSNLELLKNELYK